MTDNENTLPLQKGPLGNTGLLVSPLCAGCAPLGDMPETFGFSVAKQRAHETLRAVFKGPVNFLDTAAERRGRDLEKSPSTDERAWHHVGKKRSGYIPYAVG